MAPWSAGPRHSAAFHPQTIPLPPPSLPCFANLPVTGSIPPAETVSSESWQLVSSALTSIQGPRDGSYPELCHLQNENPRAQVSTPCPGFSLASPWAQTRKGRKKKFCSTLRRRGADPSLEALAPSPRPLSLAAWSAEGRRRLPGNFCLAGAQVRLARMGAGGRQGQESRCCWELLSQFCLSPAKGIRPPPARCKEMKSAGWRTRSLRGGCGESQALGRASLLHRAVL